MELVGLLCLKILFFFAIFLHFYSHDLTCIPSGAMAAANPASTDLECPVCLKDFQDPKLLPCSHLVCKICILSWLSTPGGQGGCPVCRAPLLPSPLPPGQSLDSWVDDLPTDLAIQSMIQTQQFLSSSHVCSLCDGSVAASSYCLQCCIKLCDPCTQKHTRIPSLQHHVVEDLKQLTAERLAETCRMPCRNHADRLAELYCSSHQELICMLCFPTNHRTCPDVQAVSDVAREKRAELRDQADRLLDQEAVLSAEIQAFQNEFKTMRERANLVFDDLKDLLQKQHKLILNNIDAEEAASMASLSTMEKDRITLKAHAETVKKLTSNAANDALLDMMGKLTARLQSLELSSKAEHQKVSAKLTFDPSQLEGLKHSISAIGSVSKVEQMTPLSGIFRTHPVAKQMPTSLSGRRDDGLAGDPGPPPVQHLQCGDQVTQGTGPEERRIRSGRKWEQMNPFTLPTGLVAKIDACITLWKAG